MENKSKLDRVKNFFNIKKHIKITIYGDYMYIMTNTNYLVEK